VGSIMRGHVRIGEQDESESEGDLVGAGGDVWEGQGADVVSEVAGFLPGVCGIVCIWRWRHLGDLPLFVGKKGCPGSRAVRAVVTCLGRLHIEH
jgi:hypothetical protein